MDSIVASIAPPRAALRPLTEALEGYASRLSLFDGSVSVVDLEAWETRFLGFYVRLRWRERDGRVCRDCANEPLVIPSWRLSALSAHERLAWTKAAAEAEALETRGFAAAAAHVVGGLPVWLRHGAQ